MMPSPYTTLLLDMGGVILSNGWDTELREKAAMKFKIDFIEMNKRHAITFDTYEIGKISLDDYLDRVVFYVDRPFTKNEFKEYMFHSAHSFHEMIDLIRHIKSKFGIRVIALTNEGRELMDERVKKFHLKEFIDIFVCSGYVGLRKPDFDIYHLALDLAQVKPQEVIYVDDRLLLVEIGRKLGLQAFQHTSFEQTRNLLNDFFQLQI